MFVIVVSRCDDHCDCGFKMWWSYNLL